MARVLEKFLIASLFMLILPIVVLFGFNHSLFPGVSSLSSESLTLLSGLLAVVSVNVVIAFYICMALKEPSLKHEPDPKFVADAKASMSQLKLTEAHSSHERSKEE